MIDNHQKCRANDHHSLSRHHRRGAYGQAGPRPAPMPSASRTSLNRPGLESGLRYTRAGGRRDALLQIVRENGFCSANELSERLGVSRVTVRRDILQLQAEGLVRAAHGGVSAISTTVTAGGPFALRRQQNRAAKRAVAQRAAEFVPEGEGVVIGIDAGTTGAELGELLADRAGLTVVTHSLPVISAFSRNRDVELVSLGGVFHTDTQAFAGPATILNLQRMRLSTVFLTTSSIRGNVMYCGNDFDAETKRTMLDLADRVIVLADSSKFATAAAFTVAPLDSVDILIVDDRLPHEVEAELARADVEVLKVPVTAPGKS
jgi:DeoR/GlpR family transcriptional regulator of sugar metabolism